MLILLGNCDNYIDREEKWKTKKRKTEKRKAQLQITFTDSTRLVKT